MRIGKIYKVITTQGNEVYRTIEYYLYGLFF